MSKRLPESRIVYSNKSCYDLICLEVDHLKKILKKDYNMMWIPGTDLNFKYWLNEQIYTNFYLIKQRYDKSDFIDYRNVFRRKTSGKNSKA